jgi:hypothetical protein
MVVLVDAEQVLFGLFWGGWGFMEYLIGLKPDEPD